MGFSPVFARIRERAGLNAVPIPFLAIENQVSLVDQGGVAFRVGPYVRFSSNWLLGGGEVGVSRHRTEPLTRHPHRLSHRFPKRCHDWQPRDNRFRNSHRLRPRPVPSETRASRRVDLARPGFRRRQSASRYGRLTSAAAAPRHVHIEAADRLLNLEEVKSIVGLGKTMIYRKMRAQEFPMACKAGGCSTRWSENEVRHWVAAQLANRHAAND